jgi:hypothetical protein
MSAWPPVNGNTPKCKRGSIVTLPPAMCPFWALKSAGTPAEKRAEHERRCWCQDTKDTPLATALTQLNLLFCSRILVGLDRTKNTG